MGNRFIDVKSEGYEALKMTLAVSWPNAPGGKARYYTIRKCSWNNRVYGSEEQRNLNFNRELVEDVTGISTLILYWEKDRNVDSLELPYPLDLEDVSDFVWRWLKHIDYPLEPDHDGSNNRGFHVFNEGWGHVMHSPYAIVAIQPNWIEYGK